jgi:hypothetical protein
MVSKYAHTKSQEWSELWDDWRGVWHDDIESVRMATLMAEDEECNEETHTHTQGSTQ